MIDTALILTDPALVKRSSLGKGVDINMDSFVPLLHEYRNVLIEVQKLREERNAFTREIKGKPTDEQLAKGKEIKEHLEKKEQIAQKMHDEEIHPVLSKIPNIIKPDVKIGKNDTENDVIKTWKDVPQFSFPVKDHLDLGKALDIIDVERAAKVSGARFAYLKNDGVLLELALVRFALDILMKEGFKPVLPPAIVSRDTMKGLGYMENGGEEDMFALTNNEGFLIGTAEQALVPLHRDETLDGNALPLRYVGFSPSFRREAGSYGKDTKGILRVHQFDKVEMVSFVEKDADDKEHEYLLSLEEKFFQSLEIPYQVVKMCSGDLGFPAARKYDIEAWMPGQNKYREVTSASTVTDFQSRRLKIRYKKGDVTEYAYVLNGTAFAIGRTIIAIMENYQREDGSIMIPKVLQPYFGKETIKK